ncbi:hypothetical protein CRENBAI_010989 [Crenichthys baileyi]|uniref:Uncharacterized protein n=1 Tax=Crenichthys baileyi TaxID=28760 RepID=A0AAV9RB09_9TELE
MDEETETQEPTERGAEGPLPSTEQPTSTQLELHRFPTEVLLGGDGYSTWASSVKKMFLTFNQEQSEETLVSQLTNQLQRDEVYYCSEIKHGYRLVVLPCPKAVQKKEDISRWLRWWTGFLEMLGLGKLVSLYSPSEKYDPIVNMVSSESGLNGYLTNPNARAMARLKDYEKETRKMTQFKESSEPSKMTTKRVCLRNVVKTESEEEGNESEQEQDQRHAEPSQGPTITPYIVRQKEDIPQRIAQTKAELQEIIRQGVLLSAAIERQTYDQHPKIRGAGPHTNAAGNPSQATQSRTEKRRKKAVEVFDIYRVSERMAIDLTWGPVQANDGRRAYIPEAGQRDYHIPAVWADCLEEKVKLRVKATVGEWANILTMPSYHTLATYQPLTSKFRSAYVGVVHDVMSRRLKKAAYKYAQEIERQVDELSAEEEEEEPPLPSAPHSTSKPIGKMSEQPTAASPEADVFREYKKIKT